MPPGNAATGDVLDRALHAARAQAPVQGQTGFFNALKPQSNLFPQTSRVNVANPAGQAKVAKRIVPPPHTPTRADALAMLPHSSSLGGIAKRIGQQVVANPLQSAASTSGLAAVAGLARNKVVGDVAKSANAKVSKGVASLSPPQDNAKLQGAANTNAGILNAAQGVDVASLSAAAQEKLKHAEAFFSVHPNFKYNVPNLGLYNDAAKKGAGLPPTATDADVIRHAFEPYLGHRDYLSQLVHNVPLNAVQLAAAPVGVAYLASQTAQGKFGAAAEAGREQVQFGKDLVQHPLKTLRDQPVTTLTTLLGGARAAGGLSGKIARTGAAGDAAKAFATPAPRDVVPAGFRTETPHGDLQQPPTINRGTTSGNLDQRVAQAASDWAAEHLPSIGKRIVKKNAVGITKTANRLADQTKRAEVQPAVDAASKIKDPERRNVLFAHGQGLKPTALADYFAKQRDAHAALEQTAKDAGQGVRWKAQQKDLNNAAELWQKTAAKYGDTLTGNQQTALTTATEASRAAETQMTHQSLPDSSDPLISPETYLRRAYVPLARVRGVEVGNPTAMDQLRSQYRAEKGAPAVDPNAPLDVHDPLYFPHVAEGPRGLARIKSGQGIGIQSGNIKPRYGQRLGKKGDTASGELFAQGKASTDPAIFFGAAAKPAHISAALKHLQQQVSSFSVEGTPGTTYDTSKWIRLDVSKGGNVTNVHTTADADQAIANVSNANKQHQLLNAFKEESGPTASIPDDGRDYVLVSRAAHKQLQNEFLHGGIYDDPRFKALQKSTNIWRWATLLARPAWLVGNVSGGGIQSGLAGAGPTSFARAMMPKYKALVPDAAQNTGFFRNTLSKPQTTPLAMASKGVHFLPDLIVRANTSFENLTRRAVYLRHEIPRAREELRAQIGDKGVDQLDTLVSIMERHKTAEEAAPVVVKTVNHWLGDFSKGKNTPILDLASPFHRWFSFIGKLTLTMPVKTPGRALLLQRLGDLGINVQNQAFGGFVPNAMQGALQLPASLPFVGGAYKTTQALNPFATGFQLLDPNDQSNTNPGSPGYSGIFSALNPAAGIAFNTITGKDFNYGTDLKDASGNPVGALNPKVLLHQLETSIPFGSLVSGYNASADSINPISPTRNRPGAFTQQPQTALERAIGYGFGTVKNFDPRKNQAGSVKRLVSAERTAARNKAKDGR
jgi:hypothetical protein